MAKLKDYNFVIPPELIPLTKSYKKWQVIQKRRLREYKHQISRNSLLREFRAYISEPYLALGEEITYMRITPDKGIRINDLYFRHSFVSCEQDKFIKFYPNKDKFGPIDAKAYINVIDHFEGTTRELRDYLNEHANSKSV